MLGPELRTGLTWGCAGCQRRKPHVSAWAAYPRAVHTVGGWVGGCAQGATISAVVGGQALWGLGMA